MCHDRVMVNYSYVAFQPLRETLRVSSTILLLWGNYKIVWRELEDRCGELLLRAMWLTTKCAMFILTLLSIFYLVLGIALAILWLDFVNLAVVNDVASKMTSFEVAMNAFYMLFSLLTLVEAGYALTLRTARVHGMTQQVCRCPNTVLIQNTDSDADEGVSVDSRRLHVFEVHHRLWHCRPRGGT